MPKYTPNICTQKQELDCAMRKESISDMHQGCRKKTWFSDNRHVVGEIPTCVLICFISSVGRAAV